MTVWLAARMERRGARLLHLVDFLAWVSCLGYMHRGRYLLLWHWHVERIIVALGGVMGERYQGLLKQPPIDWITLAYSNMIS